MPTPSATLQSLLTALGTAVQDGTLVLDAGALGSTAAASVLQLMSDQLQLSSLTLADVTLPESVADDTLAISGTTGGVAVTVAFQDLAGEVAAQLLLQASAVDPLQSMVPTLPAGFFAGIDIAGATARVTIPGVPVLTLDGPTYGVVGLATPSGGLVTTSIAPRVDGAVTPPGSAATTLLVEIATATSGFRLAPLGDSSWGFTQLGWLLTGQTVLAAFPSIIPTTSLALRSFELNLYPQAPDLSSVSLTVADATDPAEALWSAVGDTVRLTDVVVSLDLTYSSTNAIQLVGTGSVQGGVQLGSIPLVVSIPFPLTGTWSITAYPHVSLAVLDDVASLLGSGSTSFDAALPPELAGLGGFELSYLRIAVAADTYALVEFTVAFGSTQTWKLVPGVLELTALEARLTVDGTPAVRGGVIGTITLPEGGIMTVAFGRATPLLPWRLDLVSPAIALPRLSDVGFLTEQADLAALVKAGGLDQLRFLLRDVNFGMTFGPAALANLGLTLQLSGGTDPMTPTLDWELIPDVLTLTGFAFGFQLTWDPPTPARAFGSFALNDQLQFDITFASPSRPGETDADALIAQYRSLGGPDTVEIEPLIGSISDSVATTVPAGIEIHLADALLAYLGNAATKKFIFAMDVAVQVHLSDLPLVGQALPADAVVGIKQLKVVVASDALSADEVTFINGLSATPVLPLPATGASGDAIPAGFSVLAELQLGDLSILMTSPPAQSAASQGGSSQERSALVAAAPAPPADPVYWLDVQQTFGPVSISRIGFSYAAGAISVVATMAITVAGLDIELIGVGVTSPIDNPEVGYTVQGLAVSFAQDPVSIAGGMLGTLDPLDFAGVLTVRAPGMMLAAFAGYASYEDHPSFFLYGVLDVPLGGPPPFFVTGIAAGLGFNRALVIPDVSGVADFPLVAWATGNGGPPMQAGQPVGPQVAAALAQLAGSGVVPAAVGSSWFAAGVRFTSFQVVETFALVTISLGAATEIALLGLSTLTLPAAPADPVAQIQLALEVSFSTASGLLAAAGQLTANSYVLSRDCRLTGGFAVSVWFSGEHAGDFVLTVGGYSPQVTVPGHYPLVPRLGLNWQVVPELSITGGLYFALTSNTVMAGGRLSAVWTSGTIRAWFTYCADFVMILNPLRYHVIGSIDLGASFSVRLRFLSISRTVHVGVALELWGPPFAGRATVDLTVVSFTIEFPPGQIAADPATTVPWRTFVNEQLPAAIVSIMPTDGLVRTLEPNAQGPCYLVTAETFRCSVLTVIPSKQVTLDVSSHSAPATTLAYAPDTEQPGDGAGHPIPPTTTFGAGPAGLSPTMFQPELQVDLTASAAAVLHAVRQLGNAPKALWENKTFDHGTPIVDPATALTEATIPNTLVGLGLAPYVAGSDHTSAVNLSTLLFSLDDQVQSFAWSPGSPPTDDPFDHEQVATTIATPAVTTVRNALLAALAGQAVTVTTAVDVTRLSSAANDDLQAAPRMQLLGEQQA